MRNRREGGTLPKIWNMGFWHQIGEYLFIKKKDPNRPNTRSVKLMHGMNRISLLIFLAAVIVLLIRLIKHLLS